MSAEELARVAAIREYTALGLLALIIIVGAVATLYFAKILIMAHVKGQADMVAALKAGFDTHEAHISRVDANINETRHTLANFLQKLPEIVFQEMEKSEARLRDHVKDQATDVIAAFREHELIRDVRRRDEPSRMG